MFLYVLYIFTARINYDQGLLNRFKKALETSLKISVVHNISPIAGTTMILIDVDEVDSNQVLTKSTSAVQRTVSSSLFHDDL